MRKNRRKKKTLFKHNKNCFGGTTKTHYYQKKKTIDQPFTTFTIDVLFDILQKVKTYGETLLNPS